MNRLYIGVRVRLGCARVTVDGDPLPLRLDLARHSPTGFEWGYEGSGPAQLALALLAYEYNDHAAQHHYQEFKRTVVRHWTGEAWRCESADLDRWMRDRGLAP